MKDQPVNEKPFWNSLEDFVILDAFLSIFFFEV